MLVLGHGDTLTTRKLFISSIGLFHLLTEGVRLQTPVYVFYQVPTIVSAAILLAVRHLNISLPSSSPNCWWELFDAAWEDVWSVSGYIMHLYRERSAEEKMRVGSMITKKEVRRWLEDTRCI